jgi:hypothetical protein
MKPNAIKNFTITCDIMGISNNNANTILNLGELTDNFSSKLSNGVTKSVDELSQIVSDLLKTEKEVCFTSEKIPLIFSPDDTIMNNFNRVTPSNNSKIIRYDISVLFPICYTHSQISTTQ